MTEPLAFIEKIQAQIEEEEKYIGYLSEAPKKFKRSLPFVIVTFLLLAGAVIFLLISGKGNITLITITWIEFSFLFYMFYFFLLMLPSLGTSSQIKLFSKDFKAMIKEFTKLASMLKTVTKNKFTFVEFFWSSFLINTKTLAKPFMIIFGIDAVFAVGLGIWGKIEPLTTLLILVQVALIYFYYIRIITSKPGTPGFFIGTRTQVKDDSSRSRYILRKVHAGIYIIIFMLFTALALLGGLLFPGMTFGRFVDDLVQSPVFLPILMLLMIFFLLLFIRYLQGKKSVEIMSVINKNHLSILRDNLLVRVKNASAEEIPDLKREFLLLSMNKLMVQEFANRFPVYSIMPNILIIFEPEVREILSEKKEETKLTDLL